MNRKRAGSMSKSTPIKRKLRKDSNSKAQCVDLTSDQEKSEEVLVLCSSTSSTSDLPSTSTSFNEPYKSQTPCGPKCDPTCGVNYPFQPVSSLKKNTLISGRFVLPKKKVTFKLDNEPVESSEAFNWRMEDEEKTNRNQNVNLTTGNKKMYPELTEVFRGFSKGKYY